LLGARFEAAGADETAGEGAVGDEAAGEAAGSVGVGWGEAEGAGVEGAAAASAAREATHGVRVRSARKAARRSEVERRGSIKAFGGRWRCSAAKVRREER
jgi:hypothetical protein